MPNPVTQSARRRFVLPMWVIIATFGMFAGAAAAETAALDANTGTEPTPEVSANKVPPNSRDLASLWSESREQLARVEERLRLANERQAPSWQISGLQEEVSQWKYLALLYAQQQVAEEELRELQGEPQTTSLEGENLDSDDSAGAPPYSFLYLENLRDEFDDGKTLVAVLEAEVTSSVELVDRAGDYQEKNERERRRIKEQLETLDDLEPAERLRTELLRAELGCRIGRELVNLRKTELAIKKLDLENRRQRQSLLEQRLIQVEDQARFTRTDLDKKLQSIDAFEKELQNELDESQEELKQLEHLHQSIVEGSAVEAEDAALQAEAIQVAREAMHEKINHLQQSLADLVIMRHCWNLRFRMKTGQANPGEMIEWLRQVTDYAQRLRKAQEGVEIRQQEARLRLATTLKQLNEIQEPDDPRRRWLEMDHDATSQLVAASTQRIQVLHLGSRTLDRFVGELSETVRPHTAEARLNRIWRAAETCWQYELFAVEDRPITVGKIITGIIILIVGIVFARHLSRVLGRRVLPRMGIAEGACLALQTIGFYGLVIAFSLFTLELINIPITVFTFLGGAAAIAVGFGSQNILNNFMSSLILLSEQPVRIGDLVEIDGLTGTIQRIGARSTRLRTGSNVEFIIPNSKFLDSSVTNWTLSSTEIRVSVAVGVAYGSPTERVLALLRQAVHDVPQVLAHREPIILFTDFGDNALHFEAHFWIHLRTEMDGRRAESAVRLRIDRLFREAEITIAFPQRDVHLDVSQPIELKLAESQDAWKTSFNQRRAG